MFTLFFVLFVHVFFIWFKAQNVVDLTSDSSYVKLFLWREKFDGLKYGSFKFNVPNGFKVLFKERWVTLF